LPGLSIQTLKEVESEVNVWILLSVPSETIRNESLFARLLFLSLSIDATSLDDGLSAYAISAQMNNRSLEKMTV
jgi:hypothetical protein